MVARLLQYRSSYCNAAQAAAIRSERLTAKRTFLLIFSLVIVDAVRQPVKPTALCLNQVFLTHASQCLYSGEYALPLSKKAAEV
jgi:hypothetical protein